MDSEVVHVVESSLVVPSEPTPSEGLSLSPLDLVLPSRGHTPTVYLYSPSDVAAADGFFDVARLKEAMAKTLVAFYPLAGRLGVNNDGRVEITCTGEGALFVVAHADLSVGDIEDDFRPSPELRRLFVPCIEPASIILAIQVTFLKFGGVVLGTALHHTASDASSAFHFFQTWSALCKYGDRATVELPCHDRTLLRARSPPTVHPDALSRFYPKLTFSDDPLGSGPLAVEVFAISKDQVASLKRLCGGTSTFCAMSALVWQCTLIARRLPPDSETRLIFPANVRGRMRPPLPNRYFGNALIRLGVTGAVQDIASEALVSVAGRIKDTIDRMDDELVRSAVDYCEMAEMDSRPVKGTLLETELMLISWLGMPMYDTDFGWGKPAVMSRAESIRGGFVYIIDDGPTNGVGSGSGGVRVLMCMEAANMKELERLLYAKL
ncbi:putrescine hydroxycinnamoyltransferase 1 [Zea mays]|uniref:Anthranilate N-benzoyltransferase protein 1 n=1 Tax=Zea mays TaxID=4577 RepID=A0A1D6MLX4_MAIZE|nr:putrescine hydroxycinnamoyltransferase 1 [Zea mays]ONM30211.1 Anthranilate N-benzoyltransferase protein 1 [Zea mays]ONM30212.1 Anthranilate N-benzoyltransferase protein 1 [Zea mays]|eukprot:XP_008673747.1 putrescine hydroxycinnamoyltransferase 1 [Zea mays]